MKFLLAVLAVICSLGIMSPQAAQTNTVTGKWHFVFQTDGGERQYEATFQQDGSKVTGKWGDSDVKGTFGDGKLDLEFPYTSEEVGPGTLKLTGQLTGDTLSGDWSFQDYSGTYKATRGTGNDTHKTP